jgi:hypothetical protein
MDEIKLGQARDRGLRAEELLKSDSLKECFDYLSTEYMAAWRNTRGSDVVGRERMFQAINILDKIREHLAKLAANGRLATKDLAAIKYPKR